MNFYSKVPFAVTIGLLLSSCGKNVKIEKFDSYSKTNIGKVEKLPTKEEMISGIRVVVMKFDDGESPIVQKYSISTTMTGKIEKVVSEKSFIKLVDRKIAEKLKSEIILAEMNQNTSYKGPSVADYAITGKITDATFSSQFEKPLISSGALMGLVAIGSAASSKGNNLTVVSTGDGKTDGTYTYQSSVSGVLRILKIPSLEEVAVIPFDGKYESEESNDGRSTIKDMDNRVISKAMDNSIPKIKAKIFSHISPVGYVVERMDLDKESPAIFRITLGKKDGIQPGDDVQLIKIIKEMNDLTGEHSFSQTKVQVGIISDNLTDNFSWIKVSDKILADKVLIGDAITININTRKGE